jgi:hypothetical protein
LLATRRNYNPAETIVGSEPGQVIDVLLHDAAGQPVAEAITAGQTLRIAFQVLAKQVIGRPGFGIVIKSRDNVLLYGVTNLQLGVEAAPLAAGDVCEVEFGVETHLAPGHYFIDVGLSDNEDGEHHVIEWRMAVVHVTLKSNADFYGYADLRATFSFASADMEQGGGGT